MRLKRTGEYRRLVSAKLTYTFLHDDEDSAHRPRSGSVKKNERKRERERERETKRGRECVADAQDAIDDAGAQETLTMT